MRECVWHRYLADTVEVLRCVHYLGQMVLLTRSQADWDHPLIPFVALTQTIVTVGPEVYPPPVDARFKHIFVEEADAVRVFEAEAEKLRCSEPDPPEDLFRRLSQSS